MTPPHSPNPRDSSIPPGYLSRALAAVARWAHRHSVAVLALFAVLLMLAAVGTWRLSYDTDVLSLLPQDDPGVALFADTVERFGSMDLLLVAVRVPVGAEASTVFPFVDGLAERLEALPAAGPVEARLPSPEELLGTALPLAPFFLEPEGLDAVAVTLEPSGLERRAARLRRELQSPLSMALPELPRRDPLGLAPRLLANFGGGGAAGPAVDWSSGYWLSAAAVEAAPGDGPGPGPGERLVLLTSRPSRPAQDVAFSRQLVAQVEAAVAEQQAEWAGSGSPPSVVYAGGYFTAVDDAAHIQGDVITGVLTSVVAVTLLLLYAFRRFSAQVLAMLPLACGTFLTFGFAGLLVGRLSHATSGVAALLIGLGVDFTIVTYGRWLGERAEGVSVEEALATTAATAGRAVVVGAVTTAATFGAFAITDFPGLRQMGWLTAAGIGACAAAVLVLLPALLTRFEGGSASEELGLRESGATATAGGQGIVVAPRCLGAGAMMSWSRRHPAMVLLLAAIVCGLALLALPGLGFEGDLDALRPADNRGIAGAEEIAHQFRLSLETELLVIRGPSLGATLEAAAAAATACRQLEADGGVAGCTSPSQYLPEPSRQRRALQWLEGQRAMASPDQRRRQLEAALVEQGLAPAGFAPGLEAMEAMLDRSAPITLADVAGSAAGGSRLGDLLAPEIATGPLASADPARPFRALVQVLPRVDADGDAVPVRAEALEALRSAAAERLAMEGGVEGDARLTGSGAVGQRMASLARRDAPRAALFGLLLVTVLLVLDLRRLGDALLVLSPVLLGLLWMLGLMAAVGIEANFMNLFAATMIVGIGVDYGLHVVHRFRETAGRGELARGRSLSATAEAVLLASLSTVAGFGTLALSQYPGLASTGVVAIFGALASALAALTVLPALLELGDRRRAARGD